MIISSHQIVKSLGLAAIAGSLSLPISDGIAILFHPGYNPLSNSVSSLALGPMGWVQGIGLYLGGIGMIICALGLSLELSKQWEVRLGEGLMFLVGTALIITAIFHTDLHGHAPTLHGKIHGWASFAGGVSMLPVFFLLSPAVRSNRRLFIYTIIAGILQMVLEFGHGRLPSDWAFFGLQERLIGGNVVLWVVVISWAILVNTKAHTRQG